MLENTKTYTPIWFLKNRVKEDNLIPVISKLCYQMKYFIQIPSWPSDLSELKTAYLVLYLRFYVFLDSISD